MTFEPPPAPPREPEPGEDAPPPVLGSWRRLYAVVLVVLAALIALFYAFTKAFE